MSKLCIMREERQRWHRGVSEDDLRRRKTLLKRARKNINNKRKMEEVKRISVGAKSSKQRWADRRRTPRDNARVIVRIGTHYYYYYTFQRFPHILCINIC